MKRQFYYFVAFDEESGKWSVDDDTCMAVMADGTIWDYSQDGEWRPPADDEEEQLDHLLGLELRDRINRLSPE